MTSPLKKFLLGSLLCGSALLAHGQELKIGYVNLDRVLRDASPAKAAQAKLESDSHAARRI